MRDRGIIFYRGPSALDGKPIVAIATLGKSSNRKTGDMIQTWILRADLDPASAVNTGEDESICGSCPHRGAFPKSKAEPRTCYVNVGQAPLGIWRAWKRGSYSRGSMLEVATRGRPVRLGAYGDPVAVPWSSWAGIHLAPKWTGYTHQWRLPHAAAFRSVLMASCDSVADAADAARQGWRTFLVRGVDSEPLAGMLECVNVTHGKACADCGLCNGNQSWQAPNIQIQAHGTAKRFVGQEREPHLATSLAASL